jgi:protein-disulfide isomerase
MNNYSSLNQSLDPRQKKKTWIIILIILGLFFILSLSMTRFVGNKVAQFYGSEQSLISIKPDDTIYTQTKQLLYEGADNVWNVFGSAKPMVTIVEFGDFTCPYCKDNYPAIRAVAIRHQDTVQLIFRDRIPDKRSLGLALAAHCAGEQGKFWVMHDKLYQHQTDTLGNDFSQLIALGQSIGLDETTFSSCLLSQKYLSKVSKNVQSGLDLGVKGTPTFFINGTKYEGELKEAQLEDIIKELE